MMQTPLPSDGRGLLLAGGDAATTAKPCTMSPPSADDIELAELAGSFIHELKNHLATLSLNVQLLAEDFDPPETPRERRAAERIAGLHGECKKLLAISNDFLRFARVAEPNFAEVEVDDVVSRLVDFLAPTAKARRIDIAWHCEADLPRAKLDAELFETALLNLLLNAQEALPNGGRITLLLRTEGPELLLEVIDTGPGIAPDVQPKLFTAFHTNKPHGHGLGLATSRRIIRAHGGELRCESQAERGTKFTIALPRVAP